MKFRMGDEVLVTAGKDKGKKGKIERIFRDELKVLVTGVNLYKKLVKRTDDRTNQGGMTLIARPLPTANVAYVCPKCSQPTRLGYRIVGDKKVRICRKCDQEI